MKAPQTNAAPAAAEGRSEITSAVGMAVHSLRVRAGITLRELGRSSGVSPAMISRIENGQVSPSLSTLEALAIALDVPVITLFQHTVQTADIAFARAGEGLEARRIVPGHAHDYRILGSFTGNGLRFTTARVTLRKADDGTHPVYHDAGYVMITILEGRCTYACGGNLYQMDKGDTLSFDAQLSHGVRSIGTDEVTFLTVSSRPA